MGSFPCWLVAFGILGSAQDVLADDGSSVFTREDVTSADPAGGFEPFGWTLSSSPVDPNQNTATPTFGVQSIYLWLCRSSLGVPPCTGGLLSAQFGFVTTIGGPIVLAVNGLNGFLNSGSATCLQLSAGGCPPGPILAAQVLIFSLPGRICFAPCNEQDPSNPLQGGVGCDDPGFYPMAWTGLDLGAGPCSQGFSCQQHVDSGGACCMPDHTCVNTSTVCECPSSGAILRDSSPDVRSVLAAFRMDRVSKSKIIPSAPCVLPLEVSSTFSQTAIRWTVNPPQSSPIVGAEPKQSIVDWLKRHLAAAQSIRRRRTSQRR